MPTLNLSSTVRSYMNDPQAFAKRIADRAAHLWRDGYFIEAMSEVGCFAVTNLRDGEEKRYLLNVVAKTCTCPYATKNEVPQVPCKHLQGAAKLVEEQLGYYAQAARLHEFRRRKDAATLRWNQHAGLLGKWNLATDTLEANGVEMDVDTYRRWRDFDAMRDSDYFFANYDADAPLPIAIAA